MLKYSVDQHTIDQSFELCRALDINYIERGKTIPPCHRCLPSSVALWNKCKGPIDLYSRMLKNNHPKQKKLTAIGVTWLRMLRTAVYNAYQMSIVLETNRFLQSPDCTSWKVFNKHRSRIRRNEEKSLQSLQCFIGSLIDDISSFLDVESESDASAQIESKKKSYNKREAFFSVQELKDKRRCCPDSHMVKKIGDTLNGNKKIPIQQHCVWCCECDNGKASISKTKKRHYRRGRKTTTLCSVCDVPLCTQVREGHDYSCFEQWHFAKQLNNPCVPSKKRRSYDSSSNGNIHSDENNCSVINVNNGNNIFNIRCTDASRECCDVTNACNSHAHKQRGVKKQYGQPAARGYSVQSESGDSDNNTSDDGASDKYFHGYETPKIETTGKENEDASNSKRKKRGKYSKRWTGRKSS
jgi:hypothetical protein